MNKKDLDNIGDMYGKVLDGVQVVTEDAELNDKGAADVKDGGPSEKGGFKKNRLDPKTGKKDDKYDSKKFSYVDGEDECDEEDEELMVEAVQGISQVFGESAGRNDQAIEMLVEMGKISIPNLRTVIHNLNRSNKKATVNLLSTLTENAVLPLYQECKQLLDAVVRYDKRQKSEKPITESRKARRKSINTNSMKKSSFDKLFESVMDGEFDELDELGVDDNTNDEFGELGGDLEDDLEGGDEVTVSIPTELAQTLCDLLQAAVGGGEMEDVDDLEGEALDDEVVDDEAFGDGGFDEDEEGGVATGTGIPAAAGVPKALKTAVNMGTKNQVSKLKPNKGSVNTGTIPAEAGVPKAQSTNIDYGKKNSRGKLKTGKSMFDQ